jgi:hypothetical protein
MQTRHKNGKTAFYCKHVKENENVKKIDMMNEIK